MLRLLEKSGFRLDRFFVDLDPSRENPDPDCGKCEGIVTYEAARLP
jgi:hypothetical protein